MAPFPMTLQELAGHVSGEVKGACASLARVVLDTRVPMAEGDVFFALSGQRFDGAEYIENAWSMGASAAVVSRHHARATLVPPEGKALICVEDSLDALQALAAVRRRAFRGRVIGITGSNGKTTVKELLRAALGEALQVYASPLSWNSQVGVAMTLLQLDAAADIALIECGISRPGEMDRLAAMVQPDIGVFVNVGDAHRDTLHTLEITAHEKAKLFSKPAALPVFVPHSETRAKEALDAVGAQAFVVGEVQGRSLAMQWGADGSTLAMGEQVVSIPPTPLGLRVDIELAVAVALTLGVDPEVVSRGLQQWAPAPMRLEMTMTPQGVFVLNDAYSADPESFDVALRSLKASQLEGRAFSVIGPLAQLGKRRGAAHERVGRAVAQANLDGLFLVGEDARDIGEAAQKAGLSPDVIYHVKDATEAALSLSMHVRRGDRVLVKASRPERLERVVELLFQAFGPTVAHVDLEALGANLDRLREIVGHGIAVMPVVKSFGYGLDSVRLGRLFVQHGAEALAVAYADEGVLLRERGIEVPILVQNPLPHELEKIVRYGLSSEVVDAASVDALAAVARGIDVVARVHVKVDTGMGRSGLIPEHALQTVDRVLAHPCLDIEGLMTHLASSDEPEADAFTRTQLRRFESFVEKSAQRGVRARWIHAANTAGAVRFPEARFSMVRSGIGLLGYAELPDENPFAPVLRLTTRLVSVKWMQPHETVGYGSTWTIPEGGPRRIAVVAIGYNDGYPRHLSNKGWMSIRGVRCPVVGRVCMDVTMIDTTDVPDELHSGESVVVYGQGAGEPTLHEMARLADTISYELLTRISPRVRRIFVGEISGKIAAG